ncbi:MAG TPA: hypothetical protein VGO62_06935 [Myxococcota bacterium]|jgi:hypothetical protein
MIARAVGPLVIGAAAMCSGCDFGSEAAFIDKATLSQCDDEIPVCQTTAGCKMVEEDSYLEGSFPGQRLFIVPTLGESVIRVKLFWRKQLGPGADTDITWFEPACVDDYAFESQGADIFRDSNSQGIFVKEERVFRAGDHLVKIQSDSVADYLLRTEVLTKQEFDQEKASENGFLGGGG